MFDVNNMLATVYTDSLSTVSNPVPEGEYTATSEKLEFRPVVTKDGDRVILRLTWIPQDENGKIKEATGRENAYVSQDIWLDTTPEGNLDMGKGMNIQLGRLREMWGQNVPGKGWGFNQLLRNTAKILVTHRSDNEGRIYAEVKSVTAL